MLQITCFFEKKKSDSFVSVLQKQNFETETEKQYQTAPWCIQRHDHFILFF